MDDYGLEQATSYWATCRRQRQLGRELRRIYGGVAGEPVPDDMLLLLKEIDANPSSSGPEKNGKKAGH